MCDTLGKLGGTGPSLFAKNSDRSPNEPQVIEYRPAADNLLKIVKATYIDIEQVPHTHATLLSRPTWLWGAEMGVNEFGVCIGNEAVFTRGRYARTGLTGMDLLRLALERGTSAEQSLNVILELLERYGQGGDCGYDHSFFYDNAFLIMDQKAIYILETSGREWAYRLVEQGSISNRLTIGDEGDGYSGGAKCNFSRRHLEPVYSTFSGSAGRLAQTRQCLTGTAEVPGMMRALRTHRNQSPGALTRADVASPCMHAGGLVGDHTTASMVVELGDDITVWLTGCSTPCISLFKPWRFGGAVQAPVFLAGQVDMAQEYWLARERFHRGAIGHVLPEEYYSERDALEAGWLESARQADAIQMDECTKKAMEQEEAFYGRWKAQLQGVPQGARRYLAYWQKKTAALDSPARAAVYGD